jgi:hypothetical protein
MDWPPRAGGERNTWAWKWSTTMSSPTLLSEERTFQSQMAVEWQAAALWNQKYIWPLWRIWYWAVKCDHKATGYLVGIRDHWVLRKQPHGGTSETLSRWQDGPSHQGSTVFKCPMLTPPKLSHTKGISITTQPSIPILRRDRDTEKAPFKNTSTCIWNKMNKLRAFS